MDFNSLKPSDAEWVEPTSEKDNPAVEWLKAAFTAGTARQLPDLTPDDARKVVNMLNAAGALANLGVSIRIVVGKDEFATSTELWKQIEAKKVKAVTVKFRAKERSVRPRKATTPVPPAQG
ncbi:MAG TPA: hypothetical protein VIY48_12795 [Candidatus Paceibacterota bacterium]